MRNGLIFLLFFTLGHSLAGQNTIEGVKSASVLIDGQTFKGYTSQFAFSSDQVSKGFWKYSKSFASLENFRAYYKISVTPDTGQEGLTFGLYAKTIEQGTTCSFQIALSTEGLPVEEIENYLSQTKLILLEFKTDFYVSAYQARINELSKQAKKLSKVHQKALKNGAIYLKENEDRLSKLQKIEQEIGRNRVLQLQALASLQKAKG
jgi:hypothetical protein